MSINREDAWTEFQSLKTDNQKRNNTYFLQRQAVKGNFAWPRNWPDYIPKVKHNLCKPLTERFATYLMGKGFTYNLDRPNTIDFREQAEKAEKILRRLELLSEAKIQYDEAARTGSKLGRSIFKVYRKGGKGHEHACFSAVSPDYFYGVSASNSTTTDYVRVYYSYPIDKSEAVRLYGQHAYKTEQELSRDRFYESLPEDAAMSHFNANPRIPVLEVWTKEDYLLEVGGVVIYNGVNKNKWTDTGEGFIPYVVIENIRNAEGIGESDIEQARELNEQLNYLLSRKQYMVSRWLVPTLVWEGAPANYAETLRQTLGGGGALATRMGSRLYFLAYDRPNPMVEELQATLRAAILETAGMSEIALQGTVQGSINTGPALAAQFQPVLSTIEKKRLAWESGLQRLFAMLLQVQEDIGDSDALGQAVINQERKSENDSDGEVVNLSGHDIAGLREVEIEWPGILPKDDFEAARLELEKASQGFQSVYTTLEKLGEQYPDDEIARIRMENNDPSLKGEKVAEQMRAQAPLIRAQADAAAKQAELGPQADTGGDQPPLEDQLLQDGNVGARLRDLARRKPPTMDLSQDEPTIGTGPASEAY